MERGTLKYEMTFETLHPNRQTSKIIPRLNLVNSCRIVILTVFNLNVFKGKHSRVQQTSLTTVRFFIRFCNNKYKIFLVSIHIYI